MNIDDNSNSTNDANNGSNGNRIITNTNSNANVHTSIKLGDIYHRWDRNRRPKPH